MVRDEDYYNRVGTDRISSRQIDELIGLARGICADGVINQAEAEFLQAWLGTNTVVSDQPLIHDLFVRVSEMLVDNEFSEPERAELFETLRELSGEKTELGEVLKSSSLPLCRPQPEVIFRDMTFAFTGTFQFGQRRACEKEVIVRGAFVGGVTMNTNYLIIGEYATESWKHSSMGNKILKACEYRDKGKPISIVSESHWRRFL